MCEKHFADTDYRSEKKRYLKADAIPVAYYNENDETCMKVKTPTKTYSAGKRQALLESPNTKGESSSVSKKLKFEGELEKKKSQLIDEIVELPDVQMSPRKIKLKCQIKLQSLKLKKYRKRFQTLRHKMRQKKCLINVLPCLTLLSTFARNFVSMQLRGGSRKIWKLEEKELSVSLFYKSPAAYKFLRRNGIILPSVSTIRRWISQNMFRTGMDEGIKKFLKLKCSVTSENERKCVVSFDEVKIKDLKEFNKRLDLVEGFEDLGHLGRSKETAKHAIVFFMRGLYKNWKFPISYYFCNNSLEKTILKELITYNLKSIAEIGFIPKVIVCDQGSNNRGAFRLLGVTENNPFFLLNGSKIVALFDVPHLFKSIRNNLISGMFKLNEKIINFDIIKQTFKIDSGSASGRVLTKITERHLNPNDFEKMSCKLALQVFSKTMAAAIKTCVANNLINVKEGTDTADFILSMNNLFDSLNSERLFDKNPHRCGLSEANKKAKDILIMGRDMFNSMTKISVNKAGTLVHSRPPCFDGIVQTITGIFLLFENEKKDNNTFILTKRLNQDCLENFFSIIRQQGGWNLNPSAKAFRLAFRILTITGLLKPSKLANCQEDSDVSILFDLQAANKNKPQETNGEVDLNPLRETVTDFNQNIDNIANYSETEENPNDNNFDICNPLEENAVAYYAGYLVKKVRTKFNCFKCLTPNTESLASNPAYTFLAEKNYGGSSKMCLEVPSDDVRTFVHHIYLSSKHFFNEFMHIDSLGLTLKNKLISENLPWLGNKDDVCYRHKLFFMEHLINTNLFKFCKWYKCSKKSFKQKLKNLKSN